MNLVFNICSNRNTTWKFDQLSYPAARGRGSGRPAESPCLSISSPSFRPEASSHTPWSAQLPSKGLRRRLSSQAANTGSCAARRWLSRTLMHVIFSRRQGGTRHRRSGSLPRPAIRAISCLWCHRTTGSRTFPALQRPSDVRPKFVRQDAGSPSASQRQNRLQDTAISRSQTGVKMWLT